MKIIREFKEIFNDTFKCIGIGLKSFCVYCLIIVCFVYCIKISTKEQQTYKTQSINK